MKTNPIHIKFDYTDNVLDATLYKNLVILYVSSQEWFAAKGYSIFRFDVAKNKWEYFSKISDNKNFYLSKFSLIKRFFRAEITKLYKFDDDLMICIAKKGIFKYDVKTKLFQKTIHVARGSRPLNLCRDNNGILYWGEYFGNDKQLPVHIYKSTDNGDSWEIAYTFPEGQIRHIHSICNDPFSDRLWIFTGDSDEECIIAYTQDEFKTLHIVHRGSQKYRVCSPLFYKDKIVYATDSQYEQNMILSLNRETGQITPLCEIQGSGIYGGQIGEYGFLSTTIEPSNINKDKNSYLWMSKDGINWKQICYFKKDFMPTNAFQFGSIRFPTYNMNKISNNFIFSGRSLRKIDGNSVLLSRNEI